MRAIEYCSLASLMALVQLAGGCGYKLIDYSEPPANFHSVSVQTFANDSYEPGIELVVADALRREFLRRGAVELTDDPELADLVVAGRIPPLVTRSRSFSSVSLVLEWEVTLALGLELARRDGSAVDIDGSALSDSERYLASADIEATRKNRDEAMRKMAGVLAVRIHDMLYEVAAP
jgi:hypothetical protein